MLDITVFIVIILCITVILVILSRKLPLLKKIEIEEIDKEKKTKHNILEQRLKRNVEQFKKNLGRLKSIKHAGRLTHNLKKTVLNLKKKKEEYVDELKALKNKRKQVSKHKTGESPIQETTESKNETNVILGKISRLIKEEKLEEAEAITFELIKNDPKCLAGYKLLAENYLKKKNYVHAEATFEHIVHLADRLKTIKAVDYMQLAKVKQRLEKAEESLQNAKKAVLLEPSNPKIIHYLTEMCILCKQKDLSWKYYKRLKEIDPDNNCLDDLLAKLKGLN